jgi:hypothetical protein
MKTRLVTMFTTAALAVGLTVVGAPSAQAAPCTITGFTPGNVVIGMSPVTRTFRPLTSGCVVDSWDIRDAEFNFWTWDSSPQDTFSVQSLYNEDAGPKDVIVEVTSDTFETRKQVFNDAFSMLHRTTWQSGTFNAGPEPAKRGSAITVTGRLLVANWTEERYVGYAGRSVALEFRTPTGTYQVAKRVTTDRNGWVRTTVPANTTGLWRLRYGGNAIAAPSVVLGDAVEVR